MRRHDFLPLPQGPDDFIWATGIEDTFIIDPWPASGRTLEEYELTQHYELWQEDVGLIASLGVAAARYGIPWYRVNPAPGEFDWRWTDQVVPALVATGVEPIIDLVHYGTPEWLPDSFMHPDYPERVAEYAAAFAARYRDLVRWYTPLNEPRVNAWYCGRLGLWPPYRRG
jgi:beta-glucosidase